MLNTIKNKCITKNWYQCFLWLIFLLGFFLRLKGFLINPSFWHDECALAWNVKFKTYPQLFGALDFMQMAPPFFLILTKLMTKIFGFSDMVLRLLPFLIGCFSIPAFYLLARKILNKKLSILLAVFFFAINVNLISYSFEFKPYSFDVFFIIVCLLFFINLKITGISNKKIILWGLLLSLMPWISFVTVFILVSGVINLFFKDFKSELTKKILLFLPFFVSGLVYLKIFLLSNYYSNTHRELLNFWNGYFVTGNLKHFLYLFTNNLLYFFAPIKYILFLLLFLIGGLYLLYKEKSSFLNIFCISFGLLLTVSFFHIYPFADRLVLFLLPIFLLLIAKPLDLVSFDNKLKSFIIIFLFLFTFYSQIILAFQILYSATLNKDEYPREMMQFMVKKIKPSDTIFINDVSDAEFAYYSSFYTFKNKFVQCTINNESKEKYINFLNKLKPGYYWFYIPIDYVKNPVSPWIETWAKQEKIIYYFKNNKNYKTNQSLLMYILIK